MSARVLLVCLGFAGQAVAEPSTVTILCPMRLESEVIQFKGAPAGWEPFAPSWLEVRGAELMFGPPESYAVARSSTYRKFKRRTVSTWELQGLPHAEKWLRCGYGAADEITLSHRLPKAVSRCQVTRHLDERGNVTKVEAMCSLTQ